jgi:hypothetical protein
MARDYTISLDVTVHDPDEVIKAARQRYLDETTNATDSETIVPDVEAALRFLFDPGVSPPGCEINDSSCEAAPNL